MNRAEVLEAAKKCVCGQREQDYGNPEDNFQLIADLWGAYMGYNGLFTPKDVAMMMALLKVARIRTGTGTDDCYVDLAGYAACAGEIATRAAEPEPEEGMEKALRSLQAVLGRFGERLCRSRLELEDDLK